MSKETKWWHPDGDDEQAPSIHDAAEQLQRLSPSQGYLAGQLARLFDLDRDQDEKIAHLATMLHALSEMLTETGTLDGEQLRARLGEAAEEARDRTPTERGRRGAPTVLGVPVAEVERRAALSRGDESASSLERLAGVSVADQQQHDDALERLAAERLQLEAERERIGAERRELDEAREAANRAWAEQSATERSLSEETRAEQTRLTAARAELERIEAQRRWAEERQAAAQQAAADAEAAIAATQAAAAKAEERAAEAAAKAEEQAAEAARQAEVEAKAVRQAELEAEAARQAEAEAEREAQGAADAEATDEVDAAREAEVDRWVAEPETRDEPATQPASESAPQVAEAPPVIPEAEADQAISAVDLSDSSLHESREAFFDQDYAPDRYADAMFDDYSEQRPRGGRRAALIVVALLLLIGGPVLYYGVYKNPYIGDGPAHLQVDRSKARGGDQSKAAKTGEPAKTAKTGEPAKTAKTGEPAKTAKTGEPAKGKSPAAAGKAAEATGKAPGKTDPKTDPKTPPSDPRYTALIAQANAAFAKRRRGKAFRLLRKALKVDKNGWEALDPLAWQAYSRGAMRRGRAMAKRALAGNPQAPYAILVQAASAHERGRKAAAKSGYQRFLQLCPKCPERRDITSALRSLK
jgi:chemotaxis protein histidine kinase CheA